MNNNGVRSADGYFEPGFSGFFLYHDFLPTQKYIAEGDTSLLQNLKFLIRTKQGEKSKNVARPIWGLSGRPQTPSGMHLLIIRTLSTV